MIIDFFLDVFSANREKESIIWRDKTYSYGWMEGAFRGWMRRLEEEAITPNSVVSLEADFSPTAVALLLALIEWGCIIVPLTDSVEAKKSEFREIAEVEAIIQVDRKDNACFTKLSNQATHELLLSLKQTRHPGLILSLRVPREKTKLPFTTLSRFLRSLRYADTPGEPSPFSCSIISAASTPYSTPFRTRAV